VKVLNSVLILEAGIKGITIGYARYREAVQSIRGSRNVKRAVHGRERSRKKDIRLKTASVIVNTARAINAVVVLEKLPKRCPRGMVRDVKDPALRHRIYQAGFRGVVKAIEEECLERGVPVVKLGPRGTSSTCPICGSKLMRGNAPRYLRCTRCGFGAGKDVLAVLRKPPLVEALTTAMSYPVTLLNACCAVTSADATMDSRESIRATPTAIPADVRAVLSFLLARFLNAILSSISKSTQRHRKAIGRGVKNTPARL